MQFVFNDGGRAVSGFRGRTGDCVTRAITIATGKPYREVYDALNVLAQSERPGRRRRSSSRLGIHSRIYRPYLASLGWQWTPTMHIGSGCRIHLRKSELPKGILIARLSNHLAAVIEGVLHDTYDSSFKGTRCVYGYFSRHE